MGLHKPCARFLAVEHRYKPIQGRVVTLGRQTLHFTEADAIEILRSEGCVIRAPAAGAGDAGARKFDDHAFFGMFGVDRVDSMDISDYEGATIVHNLDEPIPSRLEGQFDFVYNGSTLDNVFNPISGLRNVARLLKPGGRAILYEHASNYTNSAYLQFSPSWFSDYFIMNNFADVKAYLAVLENFGGPWDLYACPPDRSGQIRPFQSTRPVLVMVVAEKGENSTWDISPVQGVYRDPVRWDAFRRSLDTVEQSKRPWIRPRAMPSFSVQPALTMTFGESLMKRPPPPAAPDYALPVNYVGLGSFG